jgi:hypothetical protein
MIIVQSVRGLRGSDDAARPRGARAAAGATLHNPPPSPAAARCRAGRAPLGVPSKGSLNEQFRLPHTKPYPKRAPRQAPWAHALAEMLHTLFAPGLARQGLGRAEPVVVQISREDVDG